MFANFWSTCFLECLFVDDILQEADITGGPKILHILANLAPLLYWGPIKWEFFAKKFRTHWQIRQSWAGYIAPPFICIFYSKTTLFTSFGFISNYCHIGFFWVRTFCEKFFAGFLKGYDQIKYFKFFKKIFFTFFRLPIFLCFNYILLFFSNNE